MNNKLALVSLLCIASPETVAQSADDANKTNNPLNLAPSLNFQNYYTPKLFGTNAHTNDFLVRPTIPIAPGDMVSVPQILRLRDRYTRVLRLMAAIRRVLGTLMCSTSCCSNRAKST